MRELPLDKTGLQIDPPGVTPLLNQRRLGSKVEPLVTQIRRYKLITPLFGGGVEPGVSDPVTVVRGSAIRGHLRFWWRACRGGQFADDLVRMKKAEDSCWGATSTISSPVQIMVEVTSSGRDEQPFTAQGTARQGTARQGTARQGTARPRPAEGWGSLAYAAFPLQESLGIIRSEVKFTLTITFPQQLQKDVEAAIWAWETFGGIGARTRRGFGALMNLNATLPSASAEAARNYITEGIKKHCQAGTWPAGVPHLSPETVFKILANSPSPRAAWEELIEKLAAFRQNRNPGSAPGRPGRSRWPEPDEIRRLTNSKSVRHAQPLLTIPIPKFPRAVFGLPIIFHFKDEREGDPAGSTLQGKEYGRLASPLILRPLACDGNRAVGLAVLLAGTSLPPGDLILKDAPGNPVVAHELTSGEAAAISSLCGNRDVLQAFLNTL